MKHLKKSTKKNCKDICKIHEGFFSRTKILIVNGRDFVRADLCCREFIKHNITQSAIHAWNKEFWKLEKTSQRRCYPGEATSDEVSN